jgi:hypothetical protein
VTFRVKLIRTDELGQLAATRRRMATYGAASQGSDSGGYADVDIRAGKGG